MDLSTLTAKNPHIKMLSVYDEAFAPYGTVIEGYDFSEAISVMSKKDIPAEGNIYVGNDPDLAALPITKQLSDVFYGGMPAQMGFCNGNTKVLNALEYHKGVEIDVCVTDLVLLLASTYQIKNNEFDSSDVVAFFAPAGCAVELYNTTLHFAPCRVEDGGFKSIIVLPLGTNEELDSLPTPLRDEDKLLWMRNKWLIAHPDSDPAKKGALAGIKGDNIEIFY